MEVKSKEQKTFTYTLTLNSSEVDQLLAELFGAFEDVNYPKLHSFEAKLKAARNADLDDE